MTETSLFVIENDEIAVSVSAKGAEMQSVIHEGIERLWCADPAVWGRHAPLLFPFIGRLRDGQYKLGDRFVSAPVHGFCRDRTFLAERIADDALRFTTRDDEKTRDVFPFGFDLSVEYRLEGSTIVKTHEIKNTGVGPMPFEIGGHEAYATCLAPGESMADYFVRFEGCDELEMFAMDEDGILDMPKIPVPLENGCLTRTPEQLGIDTIVLENVTDSRVVLASKSGTHTVTVEFPDFPYLGIWTKALGEQSEVRYLCIEPWSALPDAHFSPAELSEKPGVITLQPNEVATLVYRMTFA